MVSELDNAIGKLIATLQQQGIEDNTLIWFMSDNGGLNPDAGLGGFVTLAETLQDWFGAPLPITMLEFIRTNALDGGSDNTPLRFGKGSVYEGGVRVPALAYWPGVIAPRHIDAMITVQDVLPTVLAATQLSVPQGLDGINQWAALRSGETQPPTDYVTMGQNGAQAYYQWPWKLIAEDDTYSLYNLDADPLEATDVAVEFPTRVDALAQHLAEVDRADTLHIPLYKVFWDPDFFGGEEDRPPWADIIERSPH